MGQLAKGTTKLIDRSSHSGPISLSAVPLSELWDYLRYHLKLKDIAEIHRGIEWNISVKENKDALIAQAPRPGFKKGLDKARGKVEPYYASGMVYLNMDEQYRRRTAHLLPWDLPKVIADARRMSSGPWRIVGFPDANGLVPTENFYGLWPKTEVEIQVLSALINSPLFNAGLFARGFGRNSPVNLLEQIPIPHIHAMDAEKISRLVQSYLIARSQLGNDATKRAVVEEECVSTIMEIDGLILKAYDLPPRLERKLLDFFRGSKRPLPSEFPDCYPPDFGPCIPLHQFLKLNLREASAAALLNRVKPLDSEEIHELATSLERGGRR
jgi:hypothetical protein